MLKRINRYNLLYILGFILLGISIFWHLNQTIQLMYFTPKVTPVKNIYAIPTEINIDKVNIHLPVQETAINNGNWQIAQNAVSHLTISARPGEKGPIILYAHNTNDKLGPIRWLSAGDNIQIKTGDGKNHQYIVTQTFDAKPSELSIFTANKEERLFLYTCDGFADLQRFILIAKPS